MPFSWIGKIIADMKRVLGSILCIVAILLIFGQIVPQPKPETTTQKIQDWAMIGVLLAIGIPLSSARKKTEDTDKK